MTTRRETTGAPARLVMTADRQEVSADGEDVAMLAVAVQDAQGRVVPITDNAVTFRVSGEGRLIGTGNGDPTDHDPDKGDIRKAFAGYCMGLVQSTKKAGSITVEATSGGLEPATVTVSSKAVQLRPQVAVWEPQVPAGPGLTGLWRPIEGGDTSEIARYLRGSGGALFTLQQSGNTLTGTVERGGGYSGDEKPVPVSDGRVEGNNISFKAGNDSYSGTVQDDQIQLQLAIRSRMRPQPEATGPRPAVGPAPDGSDPSRNPNFRPPTSITIVLRRAQR